MALSDVEKYVAEAERLGVSKVAKGPGGFLEMYRRAGVPGNVSVEWQRKRNGFIARTLAQYKKNKTGRRELSLIMWAFSPE